MVATCRVLKLAPSPTTAGSLTPWPGRDLDRAHLSNAVFDARRDGPEFGYRLMADG